MICLAHGLRTEEIADLIDISKARAARLIKWEKKGKRPTYPSEEELKSLIIELGQVYKKEKNDELKKKSGRMDEELMKVFEEVNWSDKHIGTVGINEESVVLTDRCQSENMMEKLK